MVDLAYFKIGTLGPYEFDADQTYEDDVPAALNGENHMALWSERQIKILETATSDDHVVRNADFQSALATIDSFEDVDLTGLADDNILRYDLASGDFKPEALNLSALSDTDISGLADENILQYDSGTGKWENVAPSAIAVSMDFDDLGDVQVPTPADLDILIFDVASGNKWINTTWLAMASSIEAVVSHLNISDIGTNSHAAIDTHIADGTIHFTNPGFIQSDGTVSMAATLDMDSNNIDFGNWAITGFPECRFNQDAVGTEDFVIQHDGTPLFTVQYDGATQVDGTLDVTDDLTVDGDLILDGLDIKGGSGHLTIDADANNVHASTNMNFKIDGSFICQMRYSGVVEFYTDLIVQDDLTVETDATFENDATVENDLTIDGEVNGSIVAYTMTKASSTTSHGGAGQEHFFDLANFTMSTGQGLCKWNSGSVVGYAMTYDVNSRTGYHATYITCYDDGVQLFQSTNVSNVAAANKQVTFSYARNTHAFTANGDLSFSMKSNADADTSVWNDLILTVFVMYD